MKKAILLMLVLYSAMSGFAQKAITGTVTDDAGAALLGVTVGVKGTKVGTSTDKDGKYKITVPATGKILVYTYVGMVSQEVPVADKSVINVQLLSVPSTLEDVVAIGYGTVRKKDLTGSVSVVRAKDLEQAQATEWLQALQGRAPGVNITSESGEPGSGINIQIRGANSIVGSSSPLFVVDGVQMDMNPGEVASTNSTQSTMNPMSMFNPSDIESIEVLKDASATAIYGSRGANGVIIITTKGGKAGTSILEYSGSLGFSQAAGRVDVLGASDYLTYAALRGGNDPFLMIDSDGNGTLDAPRDFSKVPSANWQDLAMRTAMTNNHSLSASGGNAKTNYSAGLGVMLQQGLLINNGFDRYNLRLRVDHKHSDKLKFGVNLNGTVTSNYGAANNGGPQSFNGVTQQLINARPWVLRATDEDLTLFDPFSETNVTPMDLLTEAYKNTRMMRVVGSANLSYKILKNLTYTGLIAGNYSNSKLQEFYNNQTSWGNFYNGLAGISQVETYSYNHSSQLNYILNKKGHNLNVLGAFEAFSYNNESFINRIANFADQSTGVNDLRKGASQLEYSSNRVGNNRLSYLGRVNYGFKNRYLLTASLRADGSDKFGPGKRWAYFPAYAFSWRISNEKFMKNVRRISDLKFRLSYGKTGNEGIPPYSYFSQLQNTFSASNNSVLFGMSPSTLANPNLQWETTSQYNIGADIGLLNNRLNFTVDYYIKRTRDMLLNAPVSAQSGFFNQWLNIGAIDNSGLELMVSSINIDKKDFKWESSFNISFNNNSVLDIGGAPFMPVTVGGSWIQNAARVVVGQPIGAMFGYKFAGIYQLSDFTWQNNSDPTIPAASRVYVLNPDQPRLIGGVARPGTLRYTDISGPRGTPDGQIDDQYDRAVIGNSTPIHFGGFNNTLQYKNFDLNVFFQWSFGNEIFNESKLREQGYQPQFNVTYDYYNNYWSETNPTNKYPGLGQIPITPSSYFVEDGSFLRFKTLGLGYNLPKKALQKLGRALVRFNVTATNLITWTNYSGLDPEINSLNPLFRGLDRFAYPRPRTIALGVNVRF
ncbi:MAG: TonB-dependent receptor [Bacteroidetes bacterium]|nr:MAG: TonB-dependent receptor [Bacteroidota bacterium]